MSVDVHQHLWTPAFTDALRRRHAAPYLDGWTLHLDGEPPFTVDPATHDLARRSAADHDLDIALVSLSSPLGIEHLPATEAWPIIEAYHEDASALPRPFRAWAATCVDDPDPGRLEKDLASGLVGLQLPATAVQGAEGLERVARLLDTLADRDRPLFVHPGPAARHDGTPAEGPGWWPAVVTYVQQMHAAWYAWHAHGRPRHPRLRVCFALLAGLAPLHGERLLARGGSGRGRVDPLTFVETSSYGPRAIDAVIRELGVDVVVNGSDRPYATAPETGLGAAADHAIRTANPRRLLGYPSIATCV
ncbi:amidohydrolase [Spongiactinospora sp. TRM90649]|uniref:amidohydrolase n=1 Tax=Spongiactinospora sp. TRM90649 TaxID=3031114 RepID=UPI0023FA0BE6|nr:amidohydrolase [Spongiactinospora sp. TRM90649]MDF5753273.1 amidohydrolase [Spongiactinospora sp. TRM90649]